MSELLLTQRTATRHRVQSGELTEEGVRLRLADGSVLVDDDPDLRSAQRSCRLATRILNVDISVVGSTPTAELTAVWHRAPHRRPVSVGAALALALSGVPAFVVGDCP
jgi:hypothetical protein